MQRITPFLWFNDQAEEAADFYVSVFSGAGMDARVLQTTRYSEASSRASGRAVGSVMTVAFELAGQKFTALNGGPLFSFTEAVSFVINCETQAQIDHFWEKLTGSGGKEVQCGWLTDRFGLSWQVVPTILGDLMKDPAKGSRAMGALMKMKKIDIEGLKNA